MTASTATSTRFSVRRWLGLVVASCLAFMGLAAVTVATAPAANAADPTPCVSGSNGSASMTANKVSAGLLYDQNWPGSTINVNVGPPGSTTCNVTVTRPSGWIGLIGSLGDPWKVAPAAGAAGSGLQSVTLGTVFKPNCTALAAIANVEANRPSCSTTLIEGGTSASTASISFSYVANPVLTVTKPGLGSGTVTSNVISGVQGINCGTDCLNQYPLNTVVTLTATPAVGSSFDGWQNAPGCAGLTTCQVTMSQSRSVTAVFVQDGKFQLTVENYGSGIGSVTSNSGGIDCPGTCAAEYLEGAPVQLTAEAAAGSHFVNWLGDCSGTNPVCNVTLSGNRAVGAVFELDPVPTTLTVTKNGTGAGSVTSSPAGIDCGATCAHDFDSGTLVDLTATPDAGSMFTGWSGAGCAGTAGCSVDLQAETEVFATFTAKAYQPDGLIGVGSGSKVGQGIYNTTGKKQTKASKTKRGKSVTFSWMVENDGNVTDSVKLKAGANAVGGFKVKYLVGSNDVTKKVNAGKYTKQLAVGGAVTVKVKVTVLKSADAQSTKKLLLLATSKADGAKKDAVRANITAK